MAEPDASEHIFRRALEKSPELTVVLAADPPHFTALAVSDAYLDITVFSRDELLGRPIFDAFPDHIDEPQSVPVERIKKGLLEVLHQKQPISHGPFRFDIPRPESQGGGFAERYWSPRSLPIFGDDGEVIAILHRVEDVSAYVLRERERGYEPDQRGTARVLDQYSRAVEERSRRQFYNLFMQTPAFIAVLEGPEHVYSLANPAYYDLVGGRELVGRTVHEAIPDPDLEPFLEALDEVYRTGEARSYDEQELIFRSPHTDREARRYATFVFLPHRDLHGAIEGVAIFGSDVTELVEARNKLAEQAERAERENRHKDEFLAMLGHELRNPLAPIASAVDLVECISIKEQPDKVEWVMSIIGRQLAQLSRLVDDLLDVARINRGRIELKRQRCRLNEVIAAAVEVSEPLINKKNQTLRIDQPEQPVIIDVDATRMSQVMANLLNNASKYTHEGGHIELEASVDDENLTVEVIDDGQGMDESLVPHVFDLFTQADCSLDREQGGLGLGLTLVRRLTEMHGGTVSAESPGPGLGSRFVIEAPVVCDVDPSEQPEQSERPTPRPGGR